ncbi:TetR/AcrR family transcriptional regulator, partial [Burkholderia multivorans]
MSTERVQSNAREAQRQRTEEHILTVAAELFLDRGYRGTTVRAIAESAGVSAGRVMAVGDKDALLIACYDRWIAQLQAGTYALPHARAERPPASAVQD